MYGGGSTIPSSQRGRRETSGYSYGGAIINGRSTQGVAIGGGICSTSTTIFNAALRAGLEMGVRANHYYYIDRYPDGLDATVSIIDGWTQDMTFRNDTQHPIVVRGLAGTARSRSRSGACRSTARS